MFLRLSLSTAPCSDQRSGWSPQNLPGPGAGPAGVPDSSGSTDSGAAGPEGAEDPAGGSSSAGADGTAHLGAGGRTLPSAPQTG